MSRPLQFLSLAAGIVLGPGDVLAIQTGPPPVFQSATERFRLDTVAQGLKQPVAIAFLPDGLALLADRAAATLSLLDPRSGSLTPIGGLPEILRGEDAGLLDILLHPDYRDTGWLYLAYSTGTAERSTTAVDRAKLRGTNLIERQRLVTAQAYSEDRFHYGGRLALKDGLLFVTVGDREHQDRAQQLNNHAGKILRLRDDGQVPPDNPYVGQDSAMPEIWSYGHRNPQGLGFRPQTDVLWSHEHGPRGGDELNVIRRKANYGWPIISYGWQYAGGPIGQGIVRQEGMEQPRWVWTPAIAPSGMIFYSGPAFPSWRGSLLIGAMGQQHLSRLGLDGDRVVLEERVLYRQVGRIRCVAEDTAGLIYLCSDDGRVLRLRPE